MLFKILKNGTGTNANRACDYLLKPRQMNQDGEQTTYTPQVLRGNLDDSRRLANVLQTKNKYTVGVLSFEESDLEHKIKDEIMDSFESAIFCDLDRDRYDITWVEHRDKGRLELNFFIPNIELQSGKHLNPYYAPADKRRIANWKTLINEKYNLSSPDDPQNKQAISDKTKHYRPLKPDDPRQKTQGRELREIINKTILELAEKGEIKTRNDVLHQLKLMNLEVKRETKSSISILNPESNKNIRLTGQLYERDLHITSNNLAEMNQKQAVIWREQKDQRQELSKREYETGRQIKAEYYKQKFGENPKLSQNILTTVKTHDKTKQNNLSEAKQLLKTDISTLKKIVSTIPTPKPTNTTNNKRKQDLQKAQQATTSTECQANAEIERIGAILKDIGTVTDISNTIDARKPTIDNANKELNRAITKYDRAKSILDGTNNERPSVIGRFKKQSRDVFTGAIKGIRERTGTTSDNDNRIQRNEVGLSNENDEFSEFEEQLRELDNEQKARNNRIRNENTAIDNRISGNKERAERIRTVLHGIHNRFDEVTSVCAEYGRIETAVRNKIASYGKDNLFTQKIDENTGQPMLNEHGKVIGRPITQDEFDEMLEQPLPVLAPSLESILENALDLDISYTKISAPRR